LRNIDIINDILKALYESPDHGNKQDPMDELIYIHLSKKTNEKGYTEAFNRLSTEFPGWSGLAEADPACVNRLIASAGLGNTRTDLVIGGPPCQGWSNIGKNHTNGNNGKDFLEDERNTLYKEFVRSLDNFKPRYFVMENVPGLLTAHDGKYAKIIQEDFRNHGYKSELIRLNAANYGIPQNRKRIFFIGMQLDGMEQSGDAQQDLSNIIDFIKEQSTDGRKSFRENVAGLPHLEPGEGKNVMRLDGNKLQGMDWIQRSEEDILVFNHFTRKHTPRDLEIYRLLYEGEDYLDFSKRTKIKDLLPYSNQSFHTKFRKINGNQPCCTVISHLSRDANSYIHPDDNRGITVREAARIQSFPDGFIFLDNGFRQFIQVGNAVPPGLAEIIGNAIMKVIKSRGGQNG
jgi:DNA (cytosine-5)-methyltransferase 1